MPFECPPRRIFASRVIRLDKELRQIGIHRLGPPPHIPVVIITKG
jgi:hypothetical protein